MEKSEGYFEINTTDKITSLHEEYGYISVAFVQRKLKVTNIEAKKLIEEFHENIIKAGKFYDSD